MGVNRFGDVAYDAVAAILNDLACIGALPLVANAYFATGDSAWYARRERAEALLEGWRRACEDAGCVWGGGESPSLPGLLDEREIELAGAAVGAVPEGRAPLLGEDLRAGDEIVIVASSGLHANGASLARLVAERLHDGYATRLPDGETFGEALLAPSIMYVPLVASLLQDGAVQLSYISHVTGHGLLKLMRPQRPLTYRVERLPRVPSRARVPRRRGGARAGGRVLDVQHGLRLCDLLPPRRGPGGGRRRRPARARRGGRGTRGGGSAAGDPRAGRRPLRGLRARAVRELASAEPQPQRQGCPAAPHVARARPARTPALAAAPTTTGVAERCAATVGPLDG